MIRRINSIRALGQFVELHSGNGTEGDFGRLNVIYALNSAGKSTIADVFRAFGSGRADYLNGRAQIGAAVPIHAELLLDGRPNCRQLFANELFTSDPDGVAFPKVWVYDERFVLENVFVGFQIGPEQRRALYSVVIGEHGIDLNRRVDEAEAALAFATNELRQAESALDALVPRGMTRLEFLGLPFNDNIVNDIAEAEGQLHAASRIQESSDAVRRRPPLRALGIPQIPDRIIPLLSSTLDPASLAAEEMILRHLRDHTAGLTLDWVQNGINGQTDGICPYCSQNVNGNPLVAAYQTFFAGTLQRQQRELQAIEEEYNGTFGGQAQNDTRSTVVAHRTEQEWWNASIGFRFALPESFRVEDAIAAMERTRLALETAFRRKRENPGAQIDFTYDERTSLDIWRLTSEAIQLYNQGLLAINGEILTRQEHVQEIDVAGLRQRVERLHLLRSRQEDRVIEAGRRLELAGALHREREREKRVANAALREESDRILTEYGQRINAILERFGLNFRIVQPRVLFHGGEPSTDIGIGLSGVTISTSGEELRTPSVRSMANTLSGGDRSALAIAFFLAMLESDQRREDSIVVFDDPFHGQDRGRRRRTIEYIEGVARVSPQCFVLSHDLDFALDISRLNVDSVRTFHLTGQGGRAVIERANFPTLARNSYVQDYQLLLRFSEEPNFRGQVRLKDVVRCLRPTLESYMRYKFPQSWEESEWLGDMIRKIRDARPGSVLANAKRLLETIDHINGFSCQFYHGAVEIEPAPALDPGELLTYVKDTLGVVWG